MLEHKYAPAGRIARTIYRETIEKFLWHWEGSDAEFREPWRPTQWTHEFPLALGELLKTLDREAAMLAGIAGTSRTSDTDSRKLAELPLHEHLARHGLGLHSTVHQHRFTKRLRARDVYTAAHLVRALDKVEARAGQDSSRAGAEGRLAHILGASEAVHTTLEAATDTWPLRSRMAVILDAFISDVWRPRSGCTGPARRCIWCSTRREHVHRWAVRERLSLARSLPPRSGIPPMTCSTTGASSPGCGHCTRLRESSRATHTCSLAKARRARKPHMRQPDAAPVCSRHVSEKACHARLTMADVR